MAWITKQSASEKIERRAEPYLTPAMREKLTGELRPRFETALAAVLPALHMIQHEYGWIPHQAMLEIADCLGLKPAEVLDTATFYEEYWLKRKGECLVSVCRSIACEFCGATKVTEAIKKDLGIDVSETTEDGKFTLVELECLGSCGTAPVMLVDEDLHENVSPERAVELLAQVKSGSYKHAGSGAEHHKA
ncbi:MAG: NADH-quinone oxidoreductase subunit NuoE [Phycisphaerales bacterium]